MRIPGLKLIIPVTILSMIFFTKWWHAIPLDGPDKFFWGFPLAFVGQGFHTSGSLQLFLLEFLVDVFVHVLVWLLLLSLIKQVSIRNSIQKWINRFVLIASILLATLCGIVVFSSSPVFHWKRPYTWEVKAVGYVFIWEQTPYLHPNGQLPY